MDNLKEIREQINGIDDVIIGEFVKRLDLSAKVAEEKSKTDKPVYDPERERDIL